MYITMLSMLPSFSRLERKKKEKELESLKKKKKNFARITIR